jgi:hypothetical protein
VSECDREASIVNGFWPTRGCCAIKIEVSSNISYVGNITNIINYMCTNIYWNSVGVVTRIGARQAGNRGSITGRGGIFLFSTAFRPTVEAV